MNHEEGVIVPRYSSLTPPPLKSAHALARCRTSLSPRRRLMKSIIPAKLIFLTPRSWWHKKGERRKKKTQSSTTLCSNQHIWVGWIKKKNRAGASNRLKLLCFFFYHEMLPIIMKRTNWILFFFFFHLSNNWFDISEHFKGSLARRLCSKLQYKAEDLPLAECQVYASASLPHPVRCRRRHRRRLLASHPLPPLSLSFLPEPSESKLYTTCLHCPVCVCFSAPLCPGPASLL